MESKTNPDGDDFWGYYGTKSPLNSLNPERQQRINLENHLSEFECHRNVPEIYKCIDCNFQTNLSVTLTRHFNLNHKKEFKNQNQFRNVKGQCGFCGFQTYSILILLKHNLKCDNKKTVLTNKTRKINTCRPECGQRSFTTREKTAFRKHIQKHNNMGTADNSLFTCDKCDYKSKKKSNLQRHITAIHTDSTEIVWHRCDKCDYKAKQKVNLKQHIRNVHTDSADILWHRCDKCDYKSKRKADLKQHIINVHTDAADIVWFECDKCDYKSKQKINLKQHITNVHTDTADFVWYQCDKCDYKTKQKIYLKLHITDVHSDSAYIVWHQCDKCDYKSKRKGHLKIHITNVHTDSANV